MEGLERFDNFLITIVNETGGIEGLLHSLFGFLFRRTDFFYEMMPGEKMGFLPGEAERMVASIFKLYQNQYFKKHPPKDPKEVQKKLEEMKRLQAEAQKQAEKIGTSTIPKLAAGNTSQESTKPTQTMATGETSKPTQKQADPKITTAEKPQMTSESTSNSNQGVPSQKPTVDPKFKNISTYNGGVTEKYSWSQGVTDVSVQIDLPQKTKAKDLAVTLTSKGIKAVYKVGGKVIIEGEFYDWVKAEDSTWSIEEGERFLLNLEKGQENIWKTVLKGDPEIDATKVDNTKNLDEFDPETQGALRKIVYEQNRKAQGLPTTDEEKQMEMLKKAWDAEGSPFKGKPFDPSIINMSQNQGQGLGGGMA